MKVIVAITAASGAIYARQIVERLIADNTISQIAIVRSDLTPQVMEHEGESLPSSPKIIYFDNSNLFAPIASGSARYDSMIIAPCSVGTLCRIANGISDTLLTRAADVMLKERRKLVIVLRETPLSLIHLRAMVTLTECGAIVMPAAVSYYHNPQNIEALAATISSRAVEMIGAKGGIIEWVGSEKI